MNVRDMHLHKDARDSGPAPLLEARALEVGYGPITVLRDLDLTVHAGQVVALLGANGSGKTTALMALSGALKPKSGDVLWKGESTRAPVYRRARHGLSFVPESRSVFMQLTTADNFRVAGLEPEQGLEYFPELATRLKTRAGLLSGGEQQMLAVARGLARPSEVLLVDELSLGLAPLILGRLLDVIRQAADQGRGALIVEQHVRSALRAADYAYILRRGRVVLHGDATDLLGRLDEIEHAYLSQLHDEEDQTA